MYPLLSRLYGGGGLGSLVACGRLSGARNSKLTGSMRGSAGDGRNNRSELRPEAHEKFVVYRMRDLARRYER